MRVEMENEFISENLHVKINLHIIVICDIILLQSEKILSLCRAAGVFFLLIFITVCIEILHSVVYNKL